MPPGSDPEADRPITKRVAEGGNYGDPEDHRPDIAPPDADDEASADADDERPAECECTGADDEELPCWYCYRVGFETPAPVEDGDEE